MPERGTRVNTRHKEQTGSRCLLKKLRILEILPYPMECEGNSDEKYTKGPTPLEIQSKRSPGPPSEDELRSSVAGLFSLYLSEAMLL